MAMTRHVAWAVALAGCGWLTACGGANGSATPAGGSAAAAAAPAASAAAVAEARQIFASRCTACHGPQGHGDGPGAAGLNPPPRNYHDKAWQASVTDDEIQKAIVYGGAAVGRSPAMVGNPDLADKPDVVSALRAMVREFGKEP
jgi:mono/diheme cytochrome c family protein